MSRRALNNAARSGSGASRASVVQCPPRPPGRMLRSAAAVLALLLALATSACGNDAPTKPAPLRPVGAGQRNLQGTCPPKIVVQSNWYPTVDTATAWSLVGPGYKIDRKRKRITGPLMAHGTDTGVDIEVRAGGP